MTIKKAVYDTLVEIKGESESFSDLFERMASREKPDLLKFAGAWSKLSPKEMKDVSARMKNWREDAEKSFARRVNALA